jgi:endonuclease/exonuclease/phosphatase family metal-dependent hydrolase
VDSLNRRAVLHALVDAGALGEVHVFATHLSAVFADIPYPGEGTWAEEQAAQIRRLLDLVDERVGEGEPVVILGDLNTGPATTTLAGEVPEDFQLLIDAGFAAPYLDEDEPACTFCADNPLVGGADDDASVAIDHILVRDLSGEAQAERILDGEVTVDGPDGPTPTRLSDHYGVATTIRVEG